MTGLSITDVKNTFAKSEIGNAFECGLCSNQEFIAEFRGLFDLEGSDTELETLWNSWVQTPYHGIVEAISELQQNYQVACLSNTNDLHWEHLQTYLDLNQLFTPTYASHEINLAKPNKDCFEYVIENLGVDANDIIFLDDTQANVEAANQSGMKSYRVDPNVGAIPILKQLGLI